MKTIGNFLRRVPFTLLMLAGLAFAALVTNLFSGNHAALAQPYRFCIQ
jgi:ABC-type methionine transport system permease subunit